MNPASTTRAEVVRLLGASLGEDAARALIREAAAELSLPNDLDREQLLAIVDRLSLRVGLVGTVARFVKVRVLSRNPLARWT